MIKTETYYRVVCDSCSCSAQGAYDDDPSLFTTDTAAKLFAEESDWEVTVGQFVNRALCPRCLCDRDGHRLVVRGFCAVCDRPAETPA